MIISTENYNFELNDHNLNDHSNRFGGLINTLHRNTFIEYNFHFVDTING